MLTSLVEDVLELLDVYDYIYPRNYAQEKQRFFEAVDAGEEYNPQYEYQDFTAAKSVNQILQQIQERADTRLQQQLVAGLHGRKQLIEAVGTPGITAASKNVYGFPSEKMVQDAEEQFQPPQDESDAAEVSAEQVRDAAYELFDQLHMDYNCKLIDNETNRNDPLAKTIYIGKDITFSPARAKRMLIHESTHSVRTYNGLQANDPALTYGTNGYEVAEEGLPTFNEKEVGVFADTLPKITSRVIAIAESSRDFHSLYTLMREYGLGKRLAFIRTYRIKRGLSDTSRQGGFIKDHIYFQGYSQLMKQPELADRLYIGKISIEDIDSINRFEPAVTRSEHLDAYNTAKDMLPA